MTNPEIETLQKQLAAANHRADRWREKCRDLLVGLSSVFDSFQKEIEPYRPIINQQGFYKCCLEGLREIETAESGDVWTCPKCESKARLVGSTWEAL